MDNTSQANHLKKEIMIKLIKAFYSEDFEKNVRMVPYAMRPKGAEVPYRCCIYKERAIIKDRLIAMLGFSIECDDETVLLSEYAQQAVERENPDKNCLTVLEAACKGCVPSRIFVTELCQGCIARPCQNTCKFGAISIVNGKSVIDGAKCKNCKMCIPSCPYNAIVKITVPCEQACPVNAIAKDENGHAMIDFDKCIFCGKCIEACPFGAVHEKSQLIDVLSKIKVGKKVVAMLAPSIVGQFPGTIKQLKTALLKVGFHDVFEVAQGADVTSKNEAEEFSEKMEKGQAFMTTSCCAGYNQLIKKHLPEIEPYVSSTKTPLYYTTEIAKTKYQDAVLVFVSPCLAKRTEVFSNPDIDYVLNFNELGLVFVAQKIEIMNCEETEFENDSSKYGREFGISGGVTEAVKAFSTETNEIKPCIINGLNKDTIKQLKNMAKNGKCEGCNLVEVMCCEGGCVGGNATVNSAKIVTKAIKNANNPQ